MTFAEHQKHAKLARPGTGFYHRHELAFLGTPCSRLRPLLETLAERLGKKYKLGFLEADHKSSEPEHPFFTACTDKISFLRIDSQPGWNKFDYPLLFNHLDLLLINGNHFQGKQQVLIVDPDKSVAHKLELLTDVQLIIRRTAEDPVPQYLQDHFGSELHSIPSLVMDQHDQLANFLEKFLESRKPVLKGLVLAGGKSIRMGTDKGELKYHHKKQREHLLELLENLGLESYLSVREGQITGEDLNAKTIADSFTDLGPLGAILSAFRRDPDASWLIVATDMPFVNESILNELISKRHSTRFATAFLNEETGFPEPLLSIWEPRLYMRALQFLAQGYSCPRKVLINSEIELLRLSDPNLLINVNQPDEYEAVMRKLRSDGLTEN